MRAPAPVDGIVASNVGDAVPVGDVQRQHLRHAAEIENGFFVLVVAAAELLLRARARFQPRAACRPSRLAFRYRDGKTSFRLAMWLSRLGSGLGSGRPSIPARAPALRGPLKLAPFSDGLTDPSGNFGFHPGHRHDTGRSADHADRSRERACVNLAGDLVSVQAGSLHHFPKRDQPYRRCTDCCLLRC